jgi:hypothetical protein
MRRLLAHLALAAIFGGLLSPLAIALKSSGTPACCLPGGKHHCRQTPTGHGFNRQNEKCPYASLAIATEVKAARAAKFDLAAPDDTGYFPPIEARSGYSSVARKLSARAPPAPSL